MLSIEERTFLVKKYLETKSYKKTQEDFFAKFGKTSPCKTAIVKLVQKFNETGKLLLYNCLQKTKHLKI